MADTTTIVLIGNMIVNCFLAYLYSYRVKIEKKQIEIMAENAEARKCLDVLKGHIKLEKDDILNMNKQELREFLESIECLGEK